MVFLGLEAAVDEYKWYRKDKQKGLSHNKQLLFPWAYDDYVEKEQKAEEIPVKLPKKRRRLRKVHNGPWPSG